MRSLYSNYRILVFCVFYLLRTLIVTAQTYDYSMDNNKSSSPNGSTSFLNASANVTPSLYTGGLQLSLPLFTLKSIDLQVPISIAYTASNGVRPTDPNTCVGMDWMLSAGGSISRTVRGLPDESTYGYIGPNHEGVAVASDYTSTNSLVRLTFDGMYEVNSGTHAIDGEPDLFSITTPAFSVQFTFDQNGQPVFTGGSTGLQIINNLYSNSGLPGNNGITVIDPDGTQYVFGTQAASREQTSTVFFGTSMTYISKWYLEKIVELNSKDVVTFTYQEFGDETVHSYQLNKNFTASFPSSPWPPTTDPSGFSGVNVMNVLVGTIYYKGPKFVSTIVTKSGEADFTYTSNSVSYINNSTPPELTAVTIKQYNPIAKANSIVLKTYNLSFSDIETGLSGQTQPYSDTLVWWDYYRRTLNTITVTGNTPATSTPLTLYSMKYYQSLPFTDRELVQNCDYWGFQNSTAFLTDASNADGYYFVNPNSNRQPNSFVPSGSSQSVPMAAIFALQELDQLGGSSTIFNYQQNDYYNGSTNFPAGGARVSSVVRNLPTGESLTTTYNYYDVNGHSTGQLWSDLYRHVIFFFGSCCSVPATASSQSAFGISDDQGVMLGYSSVTVTDPNGGYTTNNFTNFSDFPDIIQPVSFAAPNFVYDNASVCENLSSFSYKRGLPTVTTAYTASGKIVSQDTKSYGSVDPGSPPPVVKSIGMQDMDWYTSNSAVYYSVNIYWSNIEDWRLVQTIHKDFDQNTPSLSLTTTTNYTYATDNRQIRSVSTTDSKGQIHSVTFYYSNDTNIPSTTTAEQTALAALAEPGVNAIGLLVHKVDSRNGVTHTGHNTYTSVQVGWGTNYFLTSSTEYTGTSVVSQQYFNYDVETALPISTVMTGGKYNSATYGYNTAYPIVKIENAANLASYTTSPISLYSNYFNFTTTNWPGGMSNSFTTTAVGTFTITLAQGVNNANETFSYNLTGPTPETGGICMTSGTGSSCQWQSSYPWNNMAPGAYTLIVSPLSTSTPGLVYITYAFNGFQVTPSGSTEYFFEGFEQNTSATAGSSHTGNMYYNGSYTVPYTPPNSRQYLIQWWKLSGSQWVFNQATYTANMTLTGPVDDVRVFPADALMTTYTYSPLVGKTSETDPSGRTKTYEYDGLERLLRIRDQDGNILRQFDYEYQAGLTQ
jgi:YD repeat-containing protein